MTERNARALLADIHELIPDAVCVVDEHGRFLFLSAAAERVFGYKPEELVGTQMIDLVHPDDRARTLATADDIMSGQPRFNFENRYIRKDGSVADIMWSARWSEKDRVRVAVARDITQRRRIQRRNEVLLAISEAAHVADTVGTLCVRIHAIVTGLLPAAHFALVLADTHQRLHVQFQSGSGDGELLARAAHVLETARLVREHLPAGEWIGLPLFAQHGVHGAMCFTCAPGARLPDADDLDLLQFVSAQVASAIERKMLHARLLYMAQHDDLTGLPNRSLFHDRLETALSRARREDSHLSLLFLDLDRFKHINDSRGHAVGDAVLKETARRLQQCVRAADTVARLSGDEFVILLEHTRSEAVAQQVADKIRATLAEPFDIEGEALPVRASIGSAGYPEHGANARQLLRHADHAMYAAKRAGRHPPA